MEFPSRCWKPSERQSNAKAMPCGLHTTIGLPDGMRYWESPLIVPINTAPAHTLCYLVTRGISRSLTSLGSALTFEPLRGNAEERWRPFSPKRHGGPGHGKQRPTISGSAANNEGGLNPKNSGVQCPEAQCRRVCMAGCCYWEINRSDISRNILPVGIT